jgi:hypothetical protein
MIYYIRSILRILAGQKGLVEKWNVVDFYGLMVPLKALGMADMISPN